MPGVIQPNRPQGSLQNLMSLGGMINTARGLMSGSGSGSGSDLSAASPQGSIGDVGNTQAATSGQAVTSDVTPYQMGDYNSPNVFQRRIQRTY